MLTSVSNTRYSHTESVIILKEAPVMKRWIFLMAILVLTCALMANQTESEPNDSAMSADGPINFNETLTGGLPGGYGGDSYMPKDYWSFSATAGNTYTFTANPHNTSFITPLDLAVSIFGAGTFSPYVEIVRADDYFDNQGETLVWTAPETTSYWLVIWEATGTVAGVPYYTCLCEEATSVEDWELY